MLNNVGLVMSEADARDAQRYRKLRTGKAFEIKTDKTVIFHAHRPESDYAEALDKAVDAMDPPPAPLYWVIGKAADGVDVAFGLFSNDTSAQSKADNLAKTNPDFTYRVWHQKNQPLEDIFFSLLD